MLGVDKEKVGLRVLVGRGAMGGDKGLGSQVGRGQGGFLWRDRKSISRGLLLSLRGS